MDCLIHQPVTHDDGSMTFTILRDQTEGKQSFKMGGYMTQMSRTTPMKIDDVMSEDASNPTGFRHPGLTSDHDGWIVTHVNGIETPLSFDADAELKKTKDNYKEPFTLTLRPPTDAERQREAASTQIIIGPGGLSLNPGAALRNSAEGQMDLARMIEAMRHGINHGELGPLLSATGTRPTVSGIEIRQDLTDEQGRRTATVTERLPANYFEDLVAAEQLLSPERQVALEAARVEARQRDEDIRETECPLCLIKEAKVVLQPCNHLAFCNECHVRCQQVGRTMCPMCRTSPTGSKQASEMIAAGETFYMP